MNPTIRRPVIIATVIIIFAIGLFMATTINPQLLRTQATFNPNDLSGTIDRSHFTQEQNIVTAQVRLRNGTIEHINKQVLLAIDSDPVEPPPDNDDLTLTILNNQPIPLNTRDEAVYIQIDYPNLDQIQCADFQVNDQPTWFTDSSPHSNFIGLCPPRPGQPTYNLNDPVYNYLRLRQIDPDQKVLTLPRERFSADSNTLTAFFRLRDGQEFQTTLTVTTGDTAGRSTEEAIAALGPACGNGLLEENESCDFGDNINNIPGCSDTCQLTSQQCELSINESVTNSPPSVSPGGNLNLTSACFAEGQQPISIFAINNKSGLQSSVSIADIDPNRQRSQTIPSLVRRNLGYDVESGGRRGIYLMRNNQVVGSYGINVTGSLPETRLSGADQWEITLATPEYSTTGTAPETFLVQLPSTVPADYIHPNNTLNFYLTTADTCPETTTATPAGSSQISYTGQTNLRLTAIDAANVRTSNQACLYLENSNTNSLELQTQAPLFLAL